MKNSRYKEFKVLRFSSAKTSRCQGVQVPRGPGAKGVLVPRGPSAKGSKCQGIQVPRGPGVKGFRCQGFPVRDTVLRVPGAEYFRFQRF